MKRICAIACGLALTLSAQAYDTPVPGNTYDGNNWANGWYIGIGVTADAQSLLKMDSKPDVFNDPQTQFDVKQVQNDAGLNVFVGHLINPYFATELSYTYVGDVEFRVKNGLGVRTDKILVEQWSINADTIGKWPIADFVNLLARAGVAYYATESRVVDLSTSIKEVDKSQSFALTYGVGIEANWKQFGLRADYRKYYPATHVRDDFYVSDVISLNYVYTFI